MACIAEHRDDAYQNVSLFFLLFVFFEIRLLTCSQSDLASQIRLSRIQIFHIQSNLITRKRMQGHTSEDRRQRYHINLFSVGQELIEQDNRRKGAGKDKTFYNYAYNKKQYELKHTAWHNDFLSRRDLQYYALF